MLRKALLQILIFLSLLCVNISQGYSQLSNLTPIIMKQNSEDSLIERYQYFKKEVSEYYTGSKPVGNWKTFNINYLEIGDIKKFDLSIKSFRNNLVKKEGYPSVMHLLIDTSHAEWKDIFYLPEAVNSEPLIPWNAFSLPIDIIETIKYLDTKFDLKNAHLFVLSVLPELYLYVDNKLYIIEGRKKYPAISYLKKKYKNKKGFLDQFKI